MLLALSALGLVCTPSSSNRSISKSNPACAATSPKTALIATTLIRPACSASVSEGGFKFGGFLFKKGESMKLFLALLTAQLFVTTPTKEPIKDYSGQFVLVTREWRSCPKQQGDYMSYEPCWDYQETYYATLADAEKALTKDDCGIFFNGDDKLKEACTEETNFVGIYKLVPALTRAQAHFTEGDKEVPAHVEAHKQHWSKWTIDGVKP
jgi:hypothetical protein